MECSVGRRSAPLLLMAFAVANTPWLSGCGGDDDVASTTSASGAGASSGGSGGSDSTSSGSGTVEPGGSFSVIEGGVKQTFSYSLEDDELIFCRSYADLGDYLWVRLAESPEANGASGPHLDIEICAFNGPGDYAVGDPLGEGCTTEPSWVVWWHEQQFVSFVNDVDADPCTLSLSETDGMLLGSFECSSLRMDELKIELRDGSFACVVEPQR